MSAPSRVLAGHTLVVLAALALLCIQVSACRADERSGESAQPAGPETPPDESRSPMHFDTLILSDVQGLHGGQNIYVAHSGRCIVQVVEPGMHETRYELTLSEEDVSELAARLGASDFANMIMTDRAGVPDEARPTIRVKAGDTVHTKAKWDNDKHAGFEHVYRWLLALVERARKGEPRYRGKLDYAWAPDGFD